MAVPTIKQICCIVGADTPCRHSYAGVSPTVNCRNSQSCYGHSRPLTATLRSLNPRILPSRQDNGTPNPLQTHLWGTFPAPSSKKCLGWHTKQPPAGPEEQLRCAIVLGKQEPPARESSSGGCHLSIGITFESPSYLQYLSNQPKNSLFQWIEFCGLRIQWFSSGKRRSLLSTPIILAALNAAIPWSTGTR